MIAEDVAERLERLATDWRTKKPLEGAASDLKRAEAAAIRASIAERGKFRRTSLATARELAAERAARQEAARVVEEAMAAYRADMGIHDALREVLEALVMERK